MPGRRTLAESLGHVKRLVTAVGADFGVALDRRGERLYLVDEQRPGGRRSSRSSCSSSACSPRTDSEGRLAFPITVTSLVERDRRRARSSRSSGRPPRSPRSRAPPPRTASSSRARSAAASSSPTSCPPTTASRASASSSSSSRPSNARSRSSSTSCRSRRSSTGRCGARWRARAPSCGSSPSG